MSWCRKGGGGALRLIESPGASSLTPYAPWPHARYVAGILVWENLLVLAINRDGFLVLGDGRENAELYLYRAADPGLWDSYTVESVFVWDAKPAVLLYRDDFFIEPASPRLWPQVFVLDRRSPLPLGAHVPALESFPPGENWEAEVVHRGPDGLWYYRVREKGTAQNETVYFRTVSLAEAGTRISVGEWRNSSRPESVNNAPPLIRALMNKLASDPGMKLFPPEFIPTESKSTKFIPTVLVISPDFEGLRVFAPETAGSSV